jgi:large subunit ribosomal protein L24
MALQRIRKDDTVMVIAGRERGKTGKVLRLASDGERVVVERINLVKRHTKPRGTQAGGILEKEASLHISNVQPLCAKCDKPARIGTKRLEDGSGVRVCRRCGEQMDKG